MMLEITGWLHCSSRRVTACAVIAAAPLEFSAASTSVLALVAALRLGRPHVFPVSALVHMEGSGDEFFGKNWNHLFVLSVV